MRSRELVPDWTVRWLSDVATIEKGRIAASAATDAPTLPLVDIAAFEREASRQVATTGTLLCDETDTLMVWDGERSGLCSAGHRGVVGSTLARIRANADLDPRLLYHQLSRAFLQIQSWRTGTGVPHVPSDLGRRLPIFAPKSESEQRRVAKILDTVDEAIRRTEGVIAKLQQVKQGLLHDLLTRGIDDNGELRDPDRHPEQFNDTPLGLRPVRWSTPLLKDVVATAYRYPTYHGIQYTDSGVPEVRGALLRDDGSVEADRARFRFVSEETACRFPRVRLAPGDLIMSVRGTVGKLALTPSWLDGAVITANLLRVAVNGRIAVPSWACHCMLSKAFQGQLDLACSATTIKTIQVPALLAIRVGLPPVPEQHAIAERLEQLDRRLYVERQLQAKLTVLKSGLRDDLLTGRVRVKAPAEVAGA